MICRVSERFLTIISPIFHTHTCSKATIEIRNQTNTTKQVRDMPTSISQVREQELSLNWAICIVTFGIAWQANQYVIRHHLMLTIELHTNHW